MFKLRQIDEQKIEFEDFCALPNSIYKSIGYDFIDMADTTAMKATEQTTSSSSMGNGRTKKPKWLRYLMNFYMVTIVFSHVFCRVYMHKHLNVTIKSGNISQLIHIVPYISFQLNSNIKFLAFTTNYKSVCNIYSELKQSFPQNAEERRHYQLKKHFWALPVQLAIGVYMVICISICVGPAVQALFQYFFHLLIWKFGAKQEAPTFVCLRTVPIEYDFNVCTPLRYPLITISEIFACYFGTATAMGTDLWLVYFLSQICMHFNYIANQVQSYQPQRQNAQKDCEFLVTLIRKHQKMFDLNEKLNDIFGVSLIVSLFSTISLFCSISVQLVTDDIGIDFFLFTILFTCVTVQFLLLCLSGQHIIDMSQNISTAAYENSWYNGSQMYKKMLLLIMLRAQKSAKLSAKQFHTISLETFQIVMGMTYRLFALLLTMLK